MHLTKERLEDIEANIDEQLVWEYLRIRSELKLSLLLSGFVTSENLIPILEEYMNFKSDELRDVIDKDRQQELLQLLS